MGRKSMLQNRVLAFAALAALLGSTALASAAESTPANVSAAVGWHGRPQGDVNRDKTIHPAAVLAYAGLKPGEVVADVMPGTGYWTRMISEIVGDKGEVDMVVIQPRDIKPAKDYNENDTLSRAQIAYSVKQQPEFKNITVLWDSLGGWPKSFNTPHQLDAVVNSDYAAVKAENPKWDMVEANKAVFRAMKNGGSYILIGAPADPNSAAKLDAAKAKDEITAAGFTFVGQSET
jgi:predicted methyltransferase